MKSTVLAAILAAAALPLAAQTNTPRIDQREANQQARIQQGVQSGQLTPRETAKLEKGQAKVDTMEAKAKSDGVVTAKERKKITKAQNKQSRKIHREKHDKQVAPKV
jgi:uncharacterized membrane protein YebE (DUF533 family)